MTEQRDFELGMPMMGPGRVEGRDEPREDPTSRTIGPSAYQGQSHDPAAGSPLLKPDASEPLTDRERAGIARRKREQEEDRARSLIEQSRSPRGVKLPGFLFGSTFILFTAALAGVFLLFVINQALTFLETLSRFPVSVQYVGLAAVSLAFSAVTLALLRVAYLYFRLNRTRHVSIGVLADLKVRDETRRLADHELGQARERLLAYLDRYPLGEEQARDLSAMGVTPDELESLRNHRARLVDRHGSLEAEQWLAEFRGGFQSALDKAASRRVRAYCLRVGVKTAIIPVPVADTAIVLWSSFMMIGDLCRIYNLRMGGLSTAVVLARSFVHAYLAAEIEEVSEKIFDSIFDSQELMAQLAGALAPRLVEGKANAFLLYRLGRATGSLLRPVSAS